MPWKEFKLMDQREHVVCDYLTGDYPMGVLCALYGISRPTGDKWLARYHPHGVAGLAACFKAPSKACWIRGCVENLLAPCVAVA